MIKKIHIVLLCFCTFSLYNSSAQGYTKKDLREQEKRIEKLQKEIAEIVADSIANANVLTANTNAVTKTKDSLRLVEREYLNSGSKASIEELLRIKQEAEQIQNENFSLDSLKGVLAEMKKKLQTSSKITVTAGEIQNLEKTQKLLVSQNNTFKNELKKEKDALNELRLKVSKIAEADKNNKLLENCIIERHNNLVGSVTRSAACNPDDINSLQKSLDQIGGLKLPTDNLKSFATYKNYCQLMKDIDAVFAKSFDKAQNDAVIQKLNQLAINSELSQEQRNLLLLKATLSKKYCEVTGASFQLIETYKEYPGLKEGIVKIADDAIKAFMEQSDAKNYPFLINELRRLYGKLNVRNGFADSKIKNCKN